MDHNNPRISIVVPTHDRERFLRQAIQSCLDQTLGDLEVIVVDDASTDGTEGLVRSFADPRVVYVKRESQGGSVAAINQGMATARGEYLTWMSDDDYYDPRAMEVLARELDRDQSVNFVYSNYMMVDEAGQPLRPARVEEPELLDRDNYVGHCVLYRRKVYEAVGDYHPKPFLAEEYEYWLRVRSKFRMKRISASLYSHRLHASSLTMKNSEDKMLEAVAEARRPFIAAWKHYFLVGERRYHTRRRWKALGHVLASVLLNPFHGPSWRLIALLVLPAFVVEKVRQSGTS